MKKIIKADITAWKHSSEEGCITSCEDNDPDAVMYKVNGFDFGCDSKYQAKKLSIELERAAQLGYRRCQSHMRRVLGI